MKYQKYTTSGCYLYKDKNKYWEPEMFPLAFFEHFFLFLRILLFSRWENYFAKSTNSQFANCSSLYLNYKFAFNDLFTFSLNFRDDKNVEFKFLPDANIGKTKMEVRRKSSEEGVSPTSNMADLDSNMADPKFSTQKVFLSKYRVLWR